MLSQKDSIFLLILMQYKYLFMLKLDWIGLICFNPQYCTKDNCNLFCIKYCKNFKDQPTYKVSLK
jgi:hypothetical protein